MHPIPIELKEWQHLSAGEPGSKLKGVFLKEDAEVKRIAGELAESGRLTITELREGLSIEVEYLCRSHLRQFACALQYSIQITAPEN